MPVAVTLWVFSFDASSSHKARFNGKAKRKFVKLGVVGESTTQILDGVNPGDKVMVEGMSRMNDGDKVLVTE